MGSSLHSHDQRRSSMAAFRSGLLELVQHAQPGAYEWLDRWLGAQTAAAGEACDDVGDVVLANVADGEGQQSGASPARAT